MSSRIRIRKNATHLDMYIRIKQNKKALMWVIAAALPWVFVLFLIEKSLLASDAFILRALILLALLLWMAVGAAGCVFLIWLYFGRERIMVNDEHILIEKPLVIYNRRNYYPLLELSNIRIDRELYKVSRNGQWQDTYRTVLAFDTPSKHVFFGRGIEKSDAEFLLLQLASSGYLQKNQFATYQKV